MYKTWKDWLAILDSSEGMTTALVVACLAFLVTLMWWTL
jgi:hypothetical protein